MKEKSQESRECTKNTAEATHVRASTKNAQQCGLLESHHAIWQGKKSKPCVCVPSVNTTHLCGGFGTENAHARALEVFAILLDLKTDQIAAREAAKQLLAVGQHTVYL